MKTTKTFFMPFLQLLFVAKFPASFDWPNVFSFVVFTHSIGLRRKKRKNDQNFSLCKNAELEQIQGVH